jgi:hypothetical protein
LATAAAATLAAASCHALATTLPFPGSTVYMRPLATIDNPDPAPTQRVLRLPPAAGIVTTTITTNLLETGPSWIVKGDKWWSLCAPRRTQIACSPITPVSNMRNIHIRAYAGVDNAPTVAYDVLPSTTRTAAELVVAMNYFQARLKTRVAHFNRFPYTPPPKKGEHSSKRGTITPMSRGGCTYDDDIVIECLADDGGGGDGTGGGGSGSGYETWEYDWTPDEDWRSVEEEARPPPSAIPTYPNGPDTDLPDPCLGPGGSNMCQQVEIMASRPHAEGCFYSLFGVVCTSRPPVIIIDEPPLPVTQPWFSQSTCNNIPVLCTKGQIPADNERVESENPGDFEADVAACAKNHEIDDNMCALNHKMGADYRTTRACYERSAARNAQCMTTARGRATGGRVQR